MDREPHRVLVVATAPLGEADVPPEMRDLAARDEVEIRVVAPAAHLSPLQWLVSDEDDAREEAEAVADEAAAKLAEEGPQSAPETEVGDPDPLQAIEDALRTFPADELLVVSPPDEEAGWLEGVSAEEALGRFGLPVRQLERGGRSS